MTEDLWKEFEIETTLKKQRSVKHKKHSLHFIKNYKIHASKLKKPILLNWLFNFFKSFIP